MGKLTHEEFVNRMSTINPDIEILSTYQGYKKKVLRRCKKCGDEKEILATVLLRGCKCECNIKKSTNEYREELKRVKPNIELLSDYINSKGKVKVRCLIDGYEWEARAGDLVTTKKGCPCCGLKKKNHRTDEEFREELAKKHPKIQCVGKFKTVGEKIEFKCEVCGYQWMTQPSCLLGRGKGCPKCNRNIRITEEDVIRRLKEINPNVEYVKGYTKMREKSIFRCKICGMEWEAQTDSVLNQGTGCPHCRESKAELRIRMYFERKNIKFISQYRFADCKDKHTLPFDFYLPEYGCLCEADGFQHEAPVVFFGGEEGLVIRQYHDKIKDNYCKEHNIPLIRISHTDFDKIERVLDKYFSQKNWKRIFGIAGKIGQLDQRGTVHTYQDYDNNAERVHIMLKDYQYTYVISDIDRVAKITFSA